MSSPANDVAAYLDAQSVGDLGGSTPWSIFVGWEPNAPVRAITIYDTGGLEPDTDDLDLQPTIQVRIRSDSYLLAVQKHEAIRDLLIEPATITVGGAVYIGFELSSDLAHIGRDDNDRDLFVANYRTRKERS